MIPDGPFLWYLNRSTGLVLLVLLTATVLLGVWSTRGAAGSRVPRFAVQSVHRNLGLLSVALLALHVTSAVVDEYVDIRWWQAFAPWQLAYKPLWLALGVVALDLMVAAAATSLVRRHLPHRAWWLLHLTTYLAWGLALVHGLGIGTDSTGAALRWSSIGSVGLVGLSVVLRLGRASRGRPAPVAASSEPPASLLPVGGAR